MDPHILYVVGIRLNLLKYDIFVRINDDFPMVFFFIWSGVFFVYIFLGILWHHNITWCHFGSPLHSKCKQKYFVCRECRWMVKALACRTDGSGYESYHASEIGHRPLLTWCKSEWWESACMIGSYNTLPKLYTTKCITYIKFRIIVRQCSS